MVIVPRTRPNADARTMDSSLRTADDGMRTLLAAQSAVAHLLAESPSLAEATPKLLEVIGRALGWQFGAIWNLDRSAGVLRNVDTWSASDFEAGEFADLTRGWTFSSEVGLPGRVLASGEPTWVVDMTRDRDLPRAPAAGAVGLRGAFAFPIRGGQGLRGVIEFFTREVRPPDDELLRMMAALGSQIGQFMEHRRAEEVVRESEARVRAMLESALDCVITIDHEGCVVEFNPAAERTFGYRRSEAVGQEMAELIVPEHLRARHRTGLARYLETGGGPVVNRRVELTGMRADGSQFPLELTVTPIALDGPPMFTGYVRDITQRKRSEERERFLLRASEALSASLDYERTFGKIAALAVPRVADFCSVDLLADDGSIHNVSLQHADPAKHELARELQRRFPPDPGAPAGAPKVIRTGRSELYEEIPDALLREVARDEDHLRLMRELDLTAAMVVPLTTRGRTLGAITLAPADSGQHGDAGYAAFAEDLARRAALAIDNARLYRQEQAVAETLQRRLLPERLPEVPGVAAAVRYLPGGGQVGGDWYDLVQLPSGKLGVVIGDVAGSGVDAASLMGQLRNAIRLSALDGQSPAEAVQRLNQLVNWQETGDMATLAYLHLDPEVGSVRYVSAGHPPPLLLAQEGSARYLKDGRSVPIGAVPDASYREGEETLEPGSTILLHTDGLVERRDRPLHETLEDLRRAAVEGPGGLDALCDHLLGSFTGESGGSDDVALLLVRWFRAREPLTLRPAVDSEAVPSVRGSLSRWLRECGASPREIYHFSVATSEAVANAVEHAYGAGEERLELEAVLEGTVVAITVRDSGRWRDSHESDGGRGINLMKGLMDSVDISTGPDGTRVDMRRRLGRDSAT